jgi:hypothetical protein
MKEKFRSLYNVMLSEEIFKRLALNCRFGSVAKIFGDQPNFPMHGRDLRSYKNNLTPPPHCAIGRVFGIPIKGYRFRFRNELI